MRKVALVGAGGKMGLRLTKNLRESPYEVAYLEKNETAQARLAGMDVVVSKNQDAVSESDIVILAVPDVDLGEVSSLAVPKMKANAMVFILDPACALAGKLYHRDDLSYFIAHPTHPSVFNWEPTEEAQKDYFGGSLAKQSVVCALYKGGEEDYSTGEQLARIIYAPVLRTHRITAKQMGMLEPALVETLCSSLQCVVKEGLDEVIRLGVPEEAARDFLLGHINIQLAVIFGQIPGAVFSDAANKAIVRGIPLLMKSDWKKVFDPDNIKVQIKDITSKDGKY